MEIVDLNTWNRKEHYAFFSKYDNPFFCLVSEVDCTQAYAFAKASHRSFFAHYLYLSTVAINQVETFRLRILEGQVVTFDAIHAAATIGRADGTFGFSFIPFSTSFSTFQTELQKEIQAVQESTGLRTNEDSRRIDVIHYSSLPWNTFTGLTHAHSGAQDSVPKISFGKAHRKGSKWMLPVAVEVHHGLMDGLHVAQYLERFQALLDSEST